MLERQWNCTYLSHSQGVSRCRRHLWYISFIWKNLYKEFRYRKINEYLSNQVCKQCCFFRLHFFHFIATAEISWHKMTTKQYISICGYGGDKQRSPSQKNDHNIENLAIYPPACTTTNRPTTTVLSSVNLAAAVYIHLTNDGWPFHSVATVRRTSRMTFCATRAAHLAAPVSMSLTRLFSCRCCILAAVVSKYKYLLGDII